MCVEEYKYENSSDLGMESGVYFLSTVVCLLVWSSVQLQYNKVLYVSLP